MLTPLLLISSVLQTVLSCHSPSLIYDEQLNNLTEYTLEELNSDCQSTLTEKQYIFAAGSWFDKAGWITKWYCAKKCAECGSLEKSVITCNGVCGDTPNTTDITCLCPSCEQHTMDVRTIGNLFEDACAPPNNATEATMEIEAVTYTSENSTVNETSSETTKESSGGTESTTGKSEVTEKSSGAAEERSESTTPNSEVAHESSKLRQQEILKALGKVQKAQP